MENFAKNFTKYIYILGTILVANYNYAYSTDNTSINEINNTKNNNNVYKNIKSNFDVLNTYKISNKNYRRSNSTSINYNDDNLNNKKGSINQERRDLKKMNEDYKRSYSLDDKNEYQYPKKNKRLKYKTLIKYGSLEPIDFRSNQVQQYFKKLNQQDNMLLNILLNVIYLIVNKFSCSKSVKTIIELSNYNKLYDLCYQISLCNYNTNITINDSYIACSNVTESINYIYKLQKLLNPQYKNKSNPYISWDSNTIKVTELCNLYRNSLIQLSHDIMYAVSKEKDIKYDIAIPCFKFLEKAFVTPRMEWDDNINELDITTQNNNFTIDQYNLNLSIKNMLALLKFIIGYHESEISKHNYKAQNKIIDKFNELYNKFENRKKQRNDKYDIRIMRELHQLIIDLKHITSKCNIVSTKNACSNNKDIINVYLNNISKVLYNFYNIYKECNSYYDAKQENANYQDEINLFEPTYDELRKKLLFNNSDTKTDIYIVPDDMKNIDYVGELEQRKKELDELDIKDILNNKDIKGILNKNKDIKQNLNIIK